MGRTHPVKCPHGAIKDWADFGPGDPEECEQCDVTCHLCGTKHPGDLVCRQSVASWCREEAAKAPPPIRTTDYWLGYNHALIEVAERVSGDSAKEDGDE